MPDQQPQTPPAAPAPVGDADVNNNKTLAAIGYIGILCLLPLFMKKESKFAQFHGKQALVLFVIEILIYFVNRGFYIYFLTSILSLVVLVLSIMGLIQALGGKWWKLPVLGDLAAKIKL